MKVSVASRLGDVKEYYFSRKLREIREMNDRGMDILNLGIGSPDLPPHDDVISELYHTAKEESNHGYQSYKGLPELRTAMAKWYGDFYKVDLDYQSEVMPLIGSKEGIMHISQTYLEKGDVVLVPNPGYPAYATAAGLAGAEVIYYDLNAKNNWEPDLSAIAKEDLSSVKIMWVNYPHMPTGKPATKALFQRLIDFGRSHQIMIINDNPYSFILNDEPLSIMQCDGAMEYAMELNSLSKAHNMAGWRVGMLVGAQDRIDNVLRFKSNMDSGMFLGVQKAAIAALRLGSDWFEKLNTVYGSRKELAMQLLDILGCTYDPNHQGLFVWAKIPGEYKDGFELSDKFLYEAKVFITPGGIFGSNGNGYVRISLCSKEAKFREAIQRVEKVKTILKKAV
ncbi:MAG: aminotransferase class I/II-fold pyridoxal phosphate-dependent enzyme [Bacteroidia bacterium]|nr:aminotransferase class I/II-fold pyridoxal phosphate-dependent enzyme [Bacteroidia bacterium]